MSRKERLVHRDSLRRSVERDPVGGLCYATLALALLRDLERADKLLAVMRHVADYFCDEGMVRVPLGIMQDAARHLDATGRKPGDPRLGPDG